MDFGALPPEVNSARMYAGPGSGPMLSAASAWDMLAGELGSAASGYASVITALAEGSWVGPASAAMAAAAAPYVEWMSTTAAQAEETATQARAAAAAYEAAFAMTVPPPVIAANRALLATLVATNVLGQNTPAIAATEAHYGEMWAQDAAAMYGYAGSSAAASRVTPFKAAPQTTTPAAQANQAGAVAQATGSSTGSGVQSTLSQVVNNVPNALQGLASPVASTSGAGGSLNLLNPNGFLNSTFLNGIISGGYFNPAFISPAATSGIADLYVVSRGAGAFGQLPTGGGLGIPALSSATLPAPYAALPNLGGPAVSAGMNQARLVGALSVPQSWATTAPATSAPVTAMPAAATAETAGMAGMPGMPGMPLTGSGGRGFGFAAPRYGFRPTVVAHPPAAG